MIKFENVPFFQSDADSAGCTSGCNELMLPCYREAANMQKYGLRPVIRFIGNGQACSFYASLCQVPE